MTSHAAVSHSLLDSTHGKDTTSLSYSNYKSYFEKLYSHYAKFVGAKKSFHDNDAIGDVEQWARIHSLLLGDGSVAPITLSAHPIQRAKFEQAQSLAPLFGELVEAVSQDSTFLIDSLSTIQDEFTRRLVDVFKATLASLGPKQTIKFGIHRSDYMIDSNSDKLLQVELNTIASGAGGLATKVSGLHQFTGDWYGARSEIEEASPTNIALESIVNGIFKAHSAYVKQQRPQSKVAVLFVVQPPPEYNQVDQNLVKFGLQEKFHVQVLRRTLLDIASGASLDPKTGALLIDGFEVSVAYFRAGYGPKDYPTEREWEARKLIEQSISIKCPNIAYQLVGAKKVQQVLADKAILRRFIADERKVELLFESFTDLLPLGKDDAKVVDVVLNTVAGKDDFVMKPQREGGGNLLSKDQMIHALQNLTESERADYILMRRIRPVEFPTLVLRNGEVFVIPNAIAELGIFTIFFKDQYDDEHSTNSYGGFLLRTKSATVEDGGISSRAYLDSPFLL